MDDEIKKSITIGSKMTGKFSCGAFENEGHEPLVSITYESVQKLPDIETIKRDIDEAIKAHEILNSRLYAQVELAEQRALQKRIQKMYDDIRWYEIDGEKLPSVTSVINFVNPLSQFVDSQRLEALASRGQVQDMILQHYIETHEWIEPHQIPEAHMHLAIMKANNLQLEGDLPGFVDKFKIKFVWGHKTVVNMEYRYAGEPDCACRFDDNPGLWLPDLKSFYASPTDDRYIRAAKQIAAYIKADTDYEYDGGVIFQIHGGNKRGWSEPQFISKDGIEKYFKMFLQDRRIFKEKLGV